MVWHQQFVDRTDLLLHSSSVHYYKIIMFGRTDISSSSGVEKGVGTRDLLDPIHRTSHKPQTTHPEEHSSVCLDRICSQSHTSRNHANTVFAALRHSRCSRCICLQDQLKSNRVDNQDLMMPRSKKPGNCFKLRFYVQLLNNDQLVSKWQ